MKEVLVAFNFLHNRLGDNAGFVRMLNERLTVHDIKATQGALKDFIFHISTGEVTVIDNNNRDIALYDMVMFRLWAREPERATAAAMYLHHKGVGFYDYEVLHANGNSKLTELVALALAGVPIPKTIMCNPGLLAELIDHGSTGLAYPFVLKDIYGLKGRLNFLVNDQTQLRQILADTKEIKFIAQECIPNDGDYRLLVFGGKVRLAIRRSRQNDTTHLNNVSQGGHSDLVPLSEIPEMVLNLAVSAAQATGREIAGVDVMYHRDTGQPYILEVNSQPEILTVFGAEKIAALAEFVEETLAITE